MNISISEIKKICVNIVKSWPFEDVSRLNTFAVLESGSDWGSNNFNKSDRDALNYDYYTTSGADRVPGFLVMEYREVDLNEILQDDLIYDLWFTVATEKPSEECDRSSRAIFQEQTVVMRHFLKELFSHQKFTVYEGGDSYDIWATPAAAAAYATDKSGEAHPQMHNLKSMLVSRDSYKIYEQGNISAYGFIGASIGVHLRVCDSILPPAWEYTSDDRGPYVPVICKSC